MTPSASWLLAGALWVGCLAGGPWWAALAGPLVLAAAVRGRSDRRRVAVAVAGLVLTGAGLAGGRLALADSALLADPGRHGQPVEVRATIASEASETAHGAWQIVAVERVDALAARERAVIRLADTGAAEPLGATVAGTVVAVPLGHEGFDGHLRRLHAVAVLHPTGSLETVADPGWLWRATTRTRDRTRAAAHRRLGDDEAVLLTALVTGDRLGEAPARRRQFAASSLTHLVVVSGRHVAVLAAGVIGLAALAGVGARGRAWLLLGALAWYVVLVRWQPSVLRAAVMAALVVTAVLAGRRTEPRHALAMAVLLLLLTDPLLAGRMGFALSVSATAGVLVAGPWLASRLPGPRWLRLPAAVTMGAQLGVTPLLLGLEGGIPIAALPANLVAVPLAAAAQVIGLVAAAVAQASVGAGAVVAAVARPFLAGVLWTAEMLAAWPSLTPAGLLAPAPAALLAAVLLRRRAPRVAAAAAVGAIVLATVAGIRPPAAVDALTVTLLDVGQGDAVLVEVPAAGDAAEARLLVDAGPDPDAALDHLRAIRVRRLDAVVLSHPHDDHSAGMPAVLRHLQVGTLLVGPDPLDDRAALSAHEAYAVARERGVPLVPLAAGEVVDVGAARATVLSPPGDGSAGDDLNEISLVLRVDHPDGRVLLTGDAEVLAQTLMLLSGRDALRADVLKVPHHGGDTNAPGFLTATGAAVALIGVGRDNPFGHPHPRVLDDLVDAGPAVYRTDLHGTVRVRLEAGTVAGVRVERPGGSAHRVSRWHTARHDRPEQRPPPAAVPRDRPRRAARASCRRPSRR